MSKMFKMVVFEDLEADVVDLAVLLRISIVASHDKAITGETGLLEPSLMETLFRLGRNYQTLGHHCQHHRAADCM